MLNKTSWPHWHNEATVSTTLRTTWWRWAMALAYSMSRVSYSLTSPHCAAPWPTSNVLGCPILQTRHLVCIHEYLVSNKSGTNDNSIINCLTLNLTASKIYLGIKGNEPGPLEHTLNYFRLEVQFVKPRDCCLGVRWNKHLVEVTKELDSRLSAFSVSPGFYFCKTRPITTLVLLTS